MKVRSMWSRKMDRQPKVGIPVPAPAQPSQKEIDRHNLTHATYRSWCGACVSSRRPNSQHRQRPDGRRQVPLFCADYAYVRDEQDPDLLTLAVGKLYPPKMIFASACDAKGPDCLLYTSPSPRDGLLSRMPSSA